MTEINKFDWSIAKIFIALAKTHGRTMLRNDIRSRVLDNRLNAAELSQLRDTHPWMKYVRIDSSEVGRNQRPIEKWVLRPEALQNQFELRTVFAYKTPPAEIFPEPKPVLPTQPPVAPPVGIEVPEKIDGITIQRLVWMPYREFEVLSDEQRRRLPIRNKDVSFWASEKNHTPEVWARVEKEKSFFPQERNKIVLPKAYFGEQEEIDRRNRDAQVIEQYIYGTSQVIPVFRTPDGLLHKYGSTIPVVVGVTHRVIPVRVGAKVKGVLLDAEGMKCHVIPIKIDQPTERHRVELVDGLLRWTAAPPPPDPSRVELEKMAAPEFKNLPPLVRLTLKDARPSMKSVIGRDGKPEWVTVEPTLSTADYVPASFTAKERAASRGRAKS